jgi:hypothetical protein
MVKGFAVDKKLNSVHLHGTHADALVMAVSDIVLVDQLQFQVVQITVTGSQLVHVRNLQSAAYAVGGGDFRPVGVAEHAPRLDPSAPTASAVYETTPLSPSKSAVTVRSAM